MLFRVVTRLDRTRFEPMIVSVMDDGEYGAAFRAAGVPVTSIGFSDRLPTPPRIARLVRTVQRCKPDVLMGWMYHGNLAASLGRAWGAPGAGLAWNIRHSVYDLGNERFLTRNLIRLGARASRRVDATVYVSDVSRRQHHGLGYASRNDVVIGNGIDPAAPATGAERLAIRTELGIAPSDVVIGHVARFHPMKDHVSFLRAATLAVEAEPSIRILLVGRGVSPENPVIRPFLRAPSLAGRVLALGERRDVPRVMGAMDVFSQSSFSEGFPNAVLEAAVAGLPCVVTDVGASSEIAGDGAVLVPPRDAPALADALRRMARLSPAGRRDLGAIARKHALANWSLEAVVATYATLLESIARSASERRPAPATGP